jgi:hypothetical protein
MFRAQLDASISFLFGQERAAHFLYLEQTQGNCVTLIVVHEEFIYSEPPGRGLTGTVCGSETDFCGKAKAFRPQSILVLSLTGRHSFVMNRILPLEEERGSKMAAKFFADFKKKKNAIAFLA